MKNAIYFMLLTSVMFSKATLAAVRITTDQFQVVTEEVQKKKNQFGAKSVLVVYDFDNTIMAMNSDLGSDQWYNWQQSALKSSDRSEAHFQNTRELFENHYKLFALIDMHLVEPQITQIIQSLQDQSIKSIVMTSRGSVLRNDTEIELDRVGLSFKASAIGPEGGYPSRLIPDNIEKPREVSFQDGLLMGSGQNKGLLLQWLLKKTGAEFKAIVFVDDTLKNVENVEVAFRDNPHVTTVYYTHEQKRVEAFLKNKKSTMKDWKQVKKLMDYLRTTAVQ